MNPAMDMYNTVWLSDYESCKSDADSLCRSGLSSLNQSQSTMPTCFSEATTPFGTPGSSRPITPSHFVGIQDPNLSAFSPDDDRISVSSWNKRKLPRTLSLPESEFATLDATDLQERFTRLQLEQENKELKKLTEDLQEALEKLEEQFIEHVQKPESERTYNNLSDASPRSPLIEKNFEPFSQSERQLLKKLRHDSDLSYDNDDYEKDKRRNCCVTQ